MDDLSESLVSAQRSQKRIFWMRVALTTLLVAAALTVLLAREAPAFLLTTRDGVLSLAAPVPTSTAVSTPLSQTYYARVLCASQRSSRANSALPLPAKRSVLI